MRVVESLLAASLFAALPSVACEMMQYRRVQASPHVHVFEAAEGTTAVMNGNIVAIVGRGRREDGTTFFAWFTHRPR